MGLLSTILVGLVAGLLASWIMKVKTGVLVDMLLGIVGGVVGGWISTLFTGVNLMSGFNLTSILVAFVGSVVVLAIYRAIAKK